MNKKGTLIFFCGKMGAGKSTYSKKLANELCAVFLSEDEWLAAIYPEEIENFDDYIKYSSRLKSLLMEQYHVIAQIEKADKAIVAEDFDTLLDIYTEDSNNLTFH